MRNFLKTFAREDADDPTKPDSVFIYVLLDPRDFGRTPKVVGATGNLEGLPKRLKNQDQYPHTLKRTRNPKQQWLRDLFLAHLDAAIEILETVDIRHDFNIWRSREKFWIKEMRRRGHDLLNENPGGEGSVWMSMRRRAETSRRNRQCKRSPETMARTKAAKEARIAAGRPDDWHGRKRTE